MCWILSGRHLRVHHSQRGQSGLHHLPPGRTRGLLSMHIYLCVISCCCHCCCLGLLIYISRWICHQSLDACIQICFPILTITYWVLFLYLSFLSLSVFICLYVYVWMCEYVCVGGGQMQAAERVCGGDPGGRAARQQRLRRLRALPPHISYGWCE